MRGKEEESETAPIAHRLAQRFLSSAVSFDVNPIHLSPIFAKLFGFPKTVIHGMYTSARAFAAAMDAGQADLKYAESPSRVSLFQRASWSF